MKKTIKENIRVEVFPREPWIHYEKERLEKYLLDLAHQIEKQIKRHCDDIGNVYVQYESFEVCSFCGYGYEIDEETKEPACCSKAIDEFKQERDSK